MDRPRVDASNEEPQIVLEFPVAEYFVSYDYGQGGLWAILEAESTEQIRNRFPDLEVFDEPPATLSAEALAVIQAAGVQSIDARPMKGWLAKLEG